jgi:hypothetical protein
VVLTVLGAGAATLALDASDLARLPVTSLTQRQQVSAGASAASDRSTIYTGVLLRDVVARAGFGTAGDRGTRVGIVEAVATDGYLQLGRAVQLEPRRADARHRRPGWAAPGCRRGPVGASLPGRHPARATARPQPLRAAGPALTAGAIS